MIPTYIINLRKRTDRREHVLKEFARREEFCPEIVEAETHKIGAVGLWKTICRILTSLEHSTVEYILLCEDDHQFTPDYSSPLLFDVIARAQARQADLLCGGVSWFQTALPASENLFWMEGFSGLQFTILFRKFFKTILEAEFKDSDAADTRISLLTQRKFFVHPFISTQKDFGYSDVTKNNNNPGRIDRLFHTSVQRVRVVKQLCDLYRSDTPDVMPFDSPPFDDLTIPTYIVPVSGRGNMREYRETQFKDRNEFSVTIMDPCAPNQKDGLWSAIREIIAVAGDEEVIALVQDTHEFTRQYSKEFLLQNVLEGYSRGTEILSGGVAGFDLAIPATEHNIWLGAFFSAQFLILYKNVFPKLLNARFDGKFTVDAVLSSLSANKMTLFPFISVQTAFGYFDPHEFVRGHPSARERFTHASKRLESIRRAYHTYCTDGVHPKETKLTDGWTI